ncbi:unnamed protein product [Ixodes persulcatus]
MSTAIWPQHPGRLLLNTLVIVAAQFGQMCATRGSCGKSHAIVTTPTQNPKLELRLLLFMVVIALRIERYFFTLVSMQTSSRIRCRLCQFATTKFDMPVEQQLLLTLMKLRLGLIYGDLSRRFSVSVSTVGNIFRAMLTTLGQVLRNVVVWLSRETIFRNIPRSFEENGFAGNTCILDCTKLFLQRPKKIALSGTEV